MDIEFISREVFAWSCGIDGDQDRSWEHFQNGGLNIGPWVRAALRLAGPAATKIQSSFTLHSCPRDIDFRLSASRIEDGERFQVFIPTSNVPILLDATPVVFEGLGPETISPYQVARRANLVYWEERTKLLAEEILVPRGEFTVLFFTASIKVTGDIEGGWKVCIHGTRQTVNQHFHVARRCKCGEKWDSCPRCTSPRKFAFGKSQHSIGFMSHISTQRGKASAQHNAGFAVGNKTNEKANTKSISSNSLGEIDVAKEQTELVNTISKDEIMHPPKATTIDASNSKNILAI